MIKKILITGCSGMLGTDLMKVLNSQFQVTGISRHPEASLSNLVFNFDLSDKEILKNKLKEVKPDLVIHAAAFTKVDLCEDKKWQAEAEKQNTEVVKNLAAICNEIQAFLIFFSTDYVFSGDKKGEYVENDKIQPINYYGLTKAKAEEVLRQESNRFMIFRVTWLYGKQGNHFPGAILKQAREKSEIPVVADQWGRPTWTKDIAVALRDLLVSRQNLLDQYNKRVFHIGNKGQVNWLGYARYLLDHKGLKHIKTKEITAKELGRAATRPCNSVLSLTQAQEDLGIGMRDWREAVKEFLDSELAEI